VPHVQVLLYSLDEGSLRARRRQQDCNGPPSGSYLR
jgi:hypothetical protein